MKKLTNASKSDIIPYKSFSIITDAVRMNLYIYSWRGK